jgi:hypothetical protein
LDPSQRTGPGPGSTPSQGPHPSMPLRNPGGEPRPTSATRCCAVCQAGHRAAAGSASHKVACGSAGFPPGGRSGPTDLAVSWSLVAFLPFRTTPRRCSPPGPVASRNWLVPAMPFSLQGFAPNRNPYRLPGLVPSCRWPWPRLQGVAPPVKRCSRKSPCLPGRSLPRGFSLTEFFPGFPRGPSVPLR